MPFAEAASGVVAPQFELLELLAIFTGTFAAAIALGWMVRHSSIGVKA